MLAFAVVPPNFGLKSAAATGFDADLARLFIDAGGDYNNGDLNARYGDRFYPAPQGEGGQNVSAAPRPQALPLLQAARAWHALGFYTTFYAIDDPGNVWLIPPDCQS